MTYAGLVRGDVSAEENTFKHVNDDVDRAKCHNSFDFHEVGPYGESQKVKDRESFDDLLLSDYIFSRGKLIFFK